MSEPRHAFVRDGRARWCKVTLATGWKCTGTIGDPIHLPPDSLIELFAQTTEREAEAIRVEACLPDCGVHLHCCRRCGHVGNAMVHTALCAGCAYLSEATLAGGGQ
jgi:hypothetical protein